MQAFTCSCKLTHSSMLLSSLRTRKAIQGQKLWGKKAELFNNKISTVSLLDFLGGKLVLRQSRINFKWVGYPLTDVRDFHTAQVIKLQEMKSESKVNHLLFIYVIHTMLIVKPDLERMLSAGLQRPNHTVLPLLLRLICWSYSPSIYQSRTKG